MPLLSDVPHPVWKDKSYVDPEREVKQYTRTDHPVRYYIIDFGLSTKFSPGEPHVARLVLGGDKSVPEYKNYPGDCDPFKVDIYHLGNIIREDFMQVCRRRLVSMSRLLISRRICRKAGPWASCNHL